MPCGARSPAPPGPVPASSSAPLRYASILPGACSHRRCSTLALRGGPLAQLTAQDRSSIYGGFHLYCLEHNRGLRRVNRPASLSEAAGDRRLMDSIYRRQRHIYDLTRKYYLLGRDRLIWPISAPRRRHRAGDRLRHRAQSDRCRQCLSAGAFFGLDISEEMLKTARAQARPERSGRGCRHRRRRCRQLRAVAPVRGAAVQPHLFLLHPIHDPALENATRPCLGPCRPRRPAHIVDFGQCEALPRPFPGAPVVVARQIPRHPARHPPPGACRDRASGRGRSGVRAALWRLCLVWRAHATCCGRPTTGTRWSRNSSAVRRQVKSRA